MAAATRMLRVAVLIFAGACVVVAGGCAVKPRAATPVVEVSAGPAPATTDPTITTMMHVSRVTESLYSGGR